MPAIKTTTLTVHIDPAVKEGLRIAGEDPPTGQAPGVEPRRRIQQGEDRGQSIPLGLLHN